MNNDAMDLDLAPELEMTVNAQIAADEGYAALEEHDEPTMIQVDNVIGKLLSRGGMPSAIAPVSIAMRFPDLSLIMHAPIEDIAVLPEVGRKRAELIVAALQLGQVAQQNMNLGGERVLSSDQLGKRLIKQLAGQMQETMHVYYLNVQNEIIEDNELFKGSIEASTIDQRLIFREALMVGATRILLAHNHPSGSLRASSADEELTTRIDTIGQLFGIKLLDHIIVGRNDYFSFKEEGLL